MPRKKKEKVILTKEKIKTIKYLMAGGITTGIIFYLIGAMPLFDVIINNLLLFITAMMYYLFRYLFLQK